MKVIITYLFCLLSVFVILSCGKLDYNKAARVSCDADRIELLLKDIMNKKYFYFDMKPVGENSVYYRNVLRLKNIPIRDSVFYWKISSRYNPDSIKLDLLKDTVNQYANTNSLGINLDKTDWDTTDVVVDISFGQNKVAYIWSKYHYEFDHKECKWFLADSVYNEY